MCLIAAFSCLFFVSASGLNITVLTYGISKESPNTNSVAYVAPAVDLGVQELHGASYGYNVSHVVLTRPSIQTCDDELTNVDLVSNFYYSNFDSSTVFVIIYAGCDSIIPLSRLSREWNILLINSAGTLPEIRNKTLHPTTLALTAVNYGIYVRAMVSVFEKYSWTNIAFIYDTWDKNPFHLLVVRELQSFVAPFPGRLNILTFPVNSLGTTASINFARTLEQANHVSRVIILGFHATIVRQFLITAAALGMTDHNYVYFAFEPFPALRRFGSLAMPQNDSFNKIALESYHQTFYMSLCSRNGNPSLTEALQEIKSNSIRDYNASYLPSEQPLEIAVMAYFATRAFAKVLNEAYFSNLSLNDGKSMAKRFFNRTFSFDVGSVYLDSNGERMPNYCFKRLSQSTGNFEDVLYFNPISAKLTTVGYSLVNWSSSSGSAPPNIPVCGYLGTSGPCDSRTKSLISIVVPILLIIIVTVLAFSMVVLRKTLVKTDIDDWWRIEPYELIKAKTRRTFSVVSALVSNMSNTGHADLTFRGGPVATNQLKLLKDFLPNKAARLALSEIRKLSHDNIVRLLGLCPEAGLLTIVHEYSEKGDLMDALEKLQLDWSDRLSLLNDMIQGIFAIHTSFFRRHGHISPYNLFINKRLTLQIGDVGIFDIIRDSDLAYEPDMETVYETQGRWAAPELKMFNAYLESKYSNARYTGPEADIYAFGAVTMLMKTDLPQSTSSEKIFSLATACLAEIPGKRPVIAAVRRVFRETYGNARGIAQNLVNRMERYAEKLESAVGERTTALLDERRLCEELLAEMLPSTVVATLLSGVRVNAEKFECVTVLFSYIMGFLDFVAEFTEKPGYVVAFLNLVFTTFDQLLSHRDIYKVETISDTYMAVSGLPVPNGERHAVEICELSLEFQRNFETITQFYTPKMDITVGVNSGSCAAGIVGNKRPRYCLFGDTVNIASRLATHGLPSKIHISTATAKLISHYSGLQTVIRGVVYLKGKGDETTYWLEAGFTSKSDLKA